MSFCKDLQWALFILISTDIEICWQGVLHMLQYQITILDRTENKKILKARPRIEN